MKGYLLGIVAAAFLVSLLNALGGSGAGQEARRLVGGILIALAVFRPLGKLDITLPELDEFQLAAEAAAASGLEQADELRLARITQEYEAYILTRAAELGLDAAAEVTVGERGYPESVTIRAAASPGERQELTGAIARELGIEREAIVWIEPHQSSESMPFGEHTNIPS